jgi:hypothetical protein
MPSSIEERAFAFANGLLAAQLAQINATRARVSTNQQIATANFNNIVQQGNQYFQSQSIMQSTFLNTIGLQYAAAANTFAAAANRASKKIGRGGLLGLIGF